MPLHVLSLQLGRPFVHWSRAAFVEAARTDVPEAASNATTFGRAR